MNMITEDKVAFVRGVAARFDLGEVMVENDGLQIGDNFFIEFNPMAISRKSLLGEQYTPGYVASVVYMSFNDEWGWDGDEVEISCQPTLVDCLKDCILHYEEMQLSKELWAMTNEYQDSFLESNFLSERENQVNL